MGAMTLTIFASGSTGNCALVSWGDTHLLVDAGLSARRTGQCLAHWGLTPKDLSACLVTHPHRDHICGLEMLTKHFDFPLYATAPATQHLVWRLPLEGRVHPFQAGSSFTVGDIAVRSIPTRHDAPGSVGYRFTSPEGKSACIVTDLGVVTAQVEEGVAGCAVAVIESNHDPEMLRTGPYPYPLRKRIAGPEGHLPNEEAAALCALAAHKGAHTIVLAHLSQQNNTPQLALAAAQQALAGFQVKLEAAPVFSEGVRFEV